MANGASIANNRVAELPPLILANIFKFSDSVTSSPRGFCCHRSMNRLSPSLLHLTAASLLHIAVLHISVRALCHPIGRCRRTPCRGCWTRQEDTKNSDMLDFALGCRGASQMQQHSSLIMWHYTSGCSGATLEMFCLIPALVSEVSQVARLTSMRRCTLPPVRWCSWRFIVQDKDVTGDLLYCVV